MHHTQDVLLAQLPIHVLIGTSLAFLFCSLAIYLVNRKIEFLWYGSYLLCVIIYFSLKSETLNELLYSSWFPIGTQIAHDTSQMCINLFYLLFSMAFLNTKTEYIRYHRFLKILVYTIFGFILIHTTLWLLGNSYDSQKQLMNVQRLALTVFVVFNIIYLLRYGKNNLVYYVVCATLLYAGGAIITWVSGNFHYMVYGVGLENFAFSFGLGYKIKLLSTEKMNAEREAAENEISSLRAQMNPHFIFNSLNSIQGFILKDKKKESIKYLTSFSTLLRKILDTSGSGVISLKQEIDLLQRYLELESLRFNGRFNHSFTVDPNLDLYNIEIPVLLIQPYVENAIIHGLVPKKDGPKQMEISFTDFSDYISCTILDSGIGRKASYDLQQSKSIYRESKGMSITEKRLELINKNKDKTNTNVTIKDLVGSDGSPNGTEVTIRIYKN